MASTAKSPTKSSITASTEFSRRGLSRSENATTPITPPARYISSNFSTPGSTYGREEDAVVLELSPRYVNAGIEGESHAQCRYEFNPVATRRVGDFRQHLPNYAKPAEVLIWETWGSEYELWRNDVKGLDLGLVADKLERAVREIYNKHLLVDAGNAKLVLVVPSLVPHPVLDTILTTLFERWSFPTISLLPNTATALVSAGLRSGIVVDIGWEETVITAMYEYREIKSWRSTRALKFLLFNLAESLKTSLPARCRVDLSTVETFWIRFAPHLHESPHKPNEGTGAANEKQGVVKKDQDDKTDGAVQDNTNAAQSEPDDVFEYDWPTQTFTEHVTLSKRTLNTVLATTLLESRKENEWDDDEELPLHILLYGALLSLPPVTKGLCSSRLVFIGDGCHRTPLPGIISESLAALLDMQQTTERILRLAEGLNDMPDVKHDDVQFSEKNITEERYLREKHKSTRSGIYNFVRQIDTLGSWTGASLLTSLKVKSFVEVQREKFLSHGIAGASRDYEQSMKAQPKTNSLAMKSKGDRISWTMAGFG